MTVGMFLGSLAFVAAALVQVEIDVSSAICRYLLLIFNCYFRKSVFKGKMYQDS